MRERKEISHRALGRVDEVGYLLPAASKKRDLFVAVRPGTGPDDDARKRG